MAGPRTLLLVPSELELARLSELGGFPLDRARVERCGFGPVAAAARTAQLLAQHSPAEVLLVGIAGSFDPARLPLGAAASFRASAIEGLDLSAGFPQWGSIRDRLPLQPARAGATAELLLTVSTPSGSAAQRLERYPEAAAEDMEGFGAAFACALAGVPCTVVRGISNAVGDRASARWRIPEALAAARELALAHLERGGPA
jgi:futalosine hydrolase